MDSKSYNYIKTFIEAQVKELNKPIEVDLQGFNDSRRLQIVVVRLNILIKRQNTNMFTPRIISQITNQIIKSEEYKIDLISERMKRAGEIMKPLALPNVSTMNYNSIDGIAQIDRLVRELPGGKYLFVEKELEAHDSNDQVMEEREESDELDDYRGPGTLVEDFEEMVQDPETERQEFKQKIYRQIDPQIGIDTELLDMYDKKRQSLIEKNEILQYKYKKMEFLKQLRDRLSEAVGDASIGNEVAKFKMLVDTINVKRNASNEHKVADMVRQL